MDPISIRWMIRRDMQEVVDIESKSFKYPWPEEDFVSALRARNCIGMVAEMYTTIAGYMIYELLDKTIRLTNFAVHPTYTRRGIGTRMIAKLVNKLSAQRRTNVSLAVRETNLDAQLFFRSCGFKATRVLREYFETNDGRHEDAYRMVLTARAFESYGRRRAESTEI